MNLYLVTFITLDGNENQVEVEARNETHASFVFEENYCYDEIISITLINQ